MSEQSISTILNIIFSVLTEVMDKPIHTFIIINNHEDDINYLKSHIKGEFTEDSFKNLLKEKFTLNSIGNKTVELIPKK